MLAHDKAIPYLRTKPRVRASEQDYSSATPPKQHRNTSQATFVVIQSEYAATFVVNSIGKCQPNMWLVFRTIPASCIANTGPCDASVLRDSLVHCASVKRKGRIVCNLPTFCRFKAFPPFSTGPSNMITQVQVKCCHLPRSCVQIRLLLHERVSNTFTVKK